MRVGEQIHTEGWRATRGAVDRGAEIAFGCTQERHRQLTNGVAHQHQRGAEREKPKVNEQVMLFTEDYIVTVAAEPQKICDKSEDAITAFTDKNVNGSSHMTIQDDVTTETVQALGVTVRWASCNIFTLRGLRQGRTRNRLYMEGRVTFQQLVVHRADADCSEAAAFDKDGAMPCPEGDSSPESKCVLQERQDALMQDCQAQARHGNVGPKHPRNLIASACQTGTRENE